MLATHYQNNPLVIGADLHNEPHAPACWGCADAQLDWHLAAQRAGDAILQINPHWLIFVEGVDCYGPAGTTNVSNCYWWGGNLQGVHTAPVTLSVAHRLVYSVHDYPASVSTHPWFSASNYPDNLTQIWDTNWGYVQKQNIAPVWVGEFGSKLQTTLDQQWFSHLVSYLGTGSGGTSWTYWSWNPDSQDTGGLLENDWKTPDQQKQQALQPILFPLAQATVIPHNDTQKVASGPQSTQAPTANAKSQGSSLQLYYKTNAPTVTMVNQITPQIKITNSGHTAINLSDVTIRYWYTDNTQQNQQYWCDYATIGCNLINGHFTSLPSSRTKANSYLEISFASNAPALNPGADTGDIQIRFNKTDWTNYDQSQNYSYSGSTGSYTLSSQITVYYHGSLIWGTEPAS